MIEPKSLEGARRINLALDLCGRCGARQLEFGYLHENKPAEEAGWYAQAVYLGARIWTAQDHPGPVEAVEALADRLLSGSTCRCGDPVTREPAPGKCLWRIVGDRDIGERWEPSCAAPSLKARLGDVAGMVQAVAVNRAERRRRK